jgi:hypothetical protein
LTEYRGTGISKNNFDIFFDMLDTPTVQPADKLSDPQLEDAHDALLK